MILSVNKPSICEKDCGCPDHILDGTKLLVVTGGPGSGKTAVLKIIRKELCKHVVILPEAASIVFGGGFWRLESQSSKMASQRAILHIQQEIERLVLDEKSWSLGLCDRGVLDGLAYWPGDEEEFWRVSGTSLQEEYGRYHAVIHLRTPSETQGYNHKNPLRTETALQAKAIDDKIASIWSKHPHYHVIESETEFLIKAQKALSHIKKYIPACCGDALRHVIK